jgi:hypothetical protein
MTTDSAPNPDDRAARENEARRDADETPTDHPTGEEQAQQNAEKELPG